MKDYTYMGLRLTFMDKERGWYALDGARVKLKAPTMSKLRKLIKIDRLKKEGIFRGEEHL